LTTAAPDVARLTALLRRRFFNRTDVVAFRPPWGGRKACPAVGGDNLDAMLAAHLDAAAPEVTVRWRTAAGKSGSKRGRFRIGTYSPTTEGMTAFAVLDFDGDTHRNPLADPLGAAIRIQGILKANGIVAHLEMSGGKGWHLWVFFAAPVSAAKVRQLLFALIPKDIPLAADGETADPQGNTGIEVFPKQGKAPNVGNQVWLPWFHGAETGRNEFYRVDDRGEVTPYKPADFETVSPDHLDTVLATISPPKKNANPFKGRAGSDGRPSADYMLRWALNRAAANTDGGRNNTGSELARQLRDNGFSKGEAESVMRDYARSVSQDGHEYTEAEALASLASAYGSPAREPWGRSGNGACHGNDDEQPQGDGEATKIEGVTNGMKTGKQVNPFGMSKIIQRVRQITDDWPRRVGGRLFVPAEGGGVSWLESASSLFGYLGSATGVVRWFKGVGCHSKEETFAELCRVATPYDAVETLPHWPRLPNHYYACTFPEPGDGYTLKQLVGRFCPSSDTDRDLIEALFITAVWGGRGGTRPAFIVTSDAGRGVGKSTLAAMVGHLVGGFIGLSSTESVEVIKQRLLSPVGLTRRVALLDNVKSLKFSWAELEAMITSPVISGKQMYVGEGTRPNTLTWIITLNGASLGTDMAQRSVIIKIDKPEHAAGWKEETFQFIDNHWTALVADCLGFFRREPAELKIFSRWSSWERDVLSRLSDPEEAQRIILERQGQADVEEEEHEIIEAFFERQFSQLGYTPATAAVFVPSEVAAAWFNQATNTKQCTTAVSRILNQAIDEGKMARITKNKCKAHGRGFVWWGENAMPGESVRTDLLDRMKAQQQRTYNPFAKRAYGT
jgi:hypothetical protein